MIKKLRGLGESPKDNGYYFVLDELNDIVTIFRFLEGEWLELSYGEWKIIKENRRGNFKWVYEE